MVEGDSGKPKSQRRPTKRLTPRRQPQPQPQGRMAAAAMGDERDLKAKGKTALSLRQLAFCDRFLVSRNATRAAVEAGYSEKSASTIAVELMSQPHIAHVIDTRIRLASEQANIRATQVLQEIAAIAFCNVANYMTVRDDGTVSFDLARLGRDQSKAIKEITVEEITIGQGENVRHVRRTHLRLHDKLKALELLGRYLGILTNPLRPGDEDEGLPQPKRLDLGKLSIDQLMQLRDIIAHAEEPGAPAAPALAGADSLGRER